MDFEKIGQFLRALRKERNLTQDQLAAELNFDRSVISKWECSKKLPSVENIDALAKFYNVSINELVYGARMNKGNARDIRNLPIKIISDSERTIHRIRMTCLITAIAAIILVLMGYFVSNYNSIKVYRVGGSTENYVVKNTLMIISKNKSYIKFGDIVSSNEHGDKEYDGYEFYAKDGDNKIVLSSREDGEIVRNLDDSDNFLNFTNLEKFIDDLYVDVYYNDEVETIKLIADLEMANNKIFNINKDDGSNIKKENKKNIDNDIPKIVSEKFSYDSDNNCYKLSLNNSGKEIRYEYYEDTRKMYIYIDEIQYLYDYTNEFIYIMSTKNNGYERLATYDLKNNECIMFDCDKYANLIKNFRDNYYELIKK